MKVGDLVTIDYEPSFGIVVELYNDDVIPSQWSIYWFDTDEWTYEYEDNLHPWVADEK